MVKSMLYFLQQRFKFYDKSVYGRLNLIGTTIFYTLALVVVAIEHNQIPFKLFRVLVFGLLFSLGTLDINNVILPYRTRYPYTIYSDKKIILRHIAFATIYGFTPQLLAFGIAIFILFILRMYGLVIFLVLSVMVFYLSKLTSGIISLISRLLILITTVTIYYRLDYLTFSSLVLNFVIIWVSINTNIIYQKIWIGKFFFRTEKFQIVPRSIFIQIFRLLCSAKYLTFIFISILTFIGYWSQLFIDKFWKLPIMLLIYALYISLVEIFVGNSLPELLIDSSRISLFNVNNQIPTLRKFMASSFYLESLLVFFAGLALTLGIFFLNGIRIIFILNIIFLPLAFFIGFVYFRKSESIINKENNKIFKFTLPLLYLLLTMIVTLVIKK